MRKQRGFTLIESMVAVVLLVLLIGFIFTIFISTRRGLNLSENHTTATMLARSILNGLYGSGYDNIYSVSEETYSIYGINNGEFWEMKYKYSVQVLKDTPPNCKTVWVNVKWDKPNTVKQDQVIVETIFYQNL